MSGLIGSLINGAKALNAHQTGVQVAGRNLANINNPEYARQRVVLGDRAIVEGPFGSVGTGVEALGIKQIRDRFLDAGVVQERSRTSYLEAQQSALERAEANLGEQIDRAADSAAPGDASHSTNGISAALNDFFNGFDNLAASPTDTGAKQVLLQKAGILANKFNVADQRMSALQDDLTAQVATGADSANNLLRQIANLNGNIAQAEIGAPGSAVDLRDQRQARIEDLAKFLNFTTAPAPEGNGQIQITTRDAAGADVLLLDRTTVRGGLKFDGVQLSGGSPAVALGLQGGSLQGQLAARDGKIQQVRDELKQTAGQLAKAVNAAYGANFFLAPPSTGLLAVDATVTVDTLRASTSGDAGANDVALAVADVGRTKFSAAGGDPFNGTIGSYFAKTVSGLGESLSGVNARLSDQSMVDTMLTTQRDAVSSVSMDEEMADLMKFQRSYQASARVVRVIDELLDGLVNGLIR